MSLKRAKFLRSVMQNKNHFITGFGFKLWNTYVCSDFDFEHFFMFYLVCLTDRLFKGNSSTSYSHCFYSKQHWLLNILEIPSTSKSFIIIPRDKGSFRKVLPPKYLEHSVELCIWSLGCNSWNMVWCQTNSVKHWGLNIQSLSGKHYY